MKRLGRWVFYGAVVVSAMLCIATAGIWHWNDACPMFVTPWHRVLSTGMRNGNSNQDIWTIDTYIDVDSKVPTGFHCYDEQTWGQNFSGLRYRNYYFWNFPVRNVIGVFALPPLIAIGILSASIATRFVKYRKNYRPGFCQTCGYDLRATPNRCPECGQIPPKKQTISA